MQIKELSKIVGIIEGKGARPKNVPVCQTLYEAGGPTGPVETSLRVTTYWAKSAQYSICCLPMMIRAEKATRVHVKPRAISARLMAPPAPVSETASPLNYLQHTTKCV